MTLNAERLLSHLITWHQIVHSSEMRAPIPSMYVSAPHHIKKFNRVSPSLHPLKMCCQASMNKTYFSMTSDIIRASPHPTPTIWGECPQHWSSWPNPPDRKVYFILVISLSSISSNIAKGPIVKNFKSLTLKMTSGMQKCQSHFLVNYVHI